MYDQEKSAEIPRKPIKKVSAKLTGTKHVSDWGGNESTRTDAL